MYDAKELYYLFKKYQITDKLSSGLKKKINILPGSIQCLKSTKRSSIYKLNVQSSSGIFPIIFKIYNANSYKNDIEVNMYNKAYRALYDFLPEIYLIEEYIQKDETWAFMEFVQQIRGQLTFTPKHFDYIIPTVANLHAQTFEDKFKREKRFQPWVPNYSSSKMEKERKKYIAKTVKFLDEGMNDKGLTDIIKPHYKQLKRIYEADPIFFPELLSNGSAITHGDLHMQNICSEDVSENKPWKIKFIDWESVKFAPTWFDMIVLVEILLGFRNDWQSRGEEIRTHCVNVYTNEMKKHGITFKTNPHTLYKMAYLQRTLEKGLHTQLRRIFDSREGVLLPYHLEKIQTWGKELGIYK
ncbi:hypothetical protein CIB95_01865 [Lottiidibacillus patelloidae]|uniref:Aminoglycoside phosphotransferase domain-containing protein n=1 Tax=Lottiidibacillus patelloidae TaxID=2670334 RepID=A0A263BYL6_9BACI|nr:oxidoreductase family protein [Lottiidibacillus patelloidae]OZM58750.1 hypothetical protein CIB95_01865 [Lottiidibacillus patelloidae]